MIHFYEEPVQRVLHNLRALRHLPPGTAVPAPAGFAERALLEDLLALPDGDDPLAWLQQERLPLCARITLQRALDQRHPPTRRHALTGGEQGTETRLQAGDQTRDGVPHAQRTLLDEETLSTALRTLRTLPSFADQPPSPFGIGQVLLELISMPDSSDPLAWLSSERPRLCACIALVQLLEASLPPRPFAIGDPLSIWQPGTEHGMCRVAPLRIGVSDIRFGPQGFTVYAQAEIALPQPMLLDEKVFYQLAWPGFEQARDLRGSCYPRVQAYDQVVTTQPGRAWLEQVQVTFYPAPGPEAVLVFTSCARRLRVLCPLPETREAFQPVELAPFEWRVDLAAGTWRNGSARP